MEGEGRGKGGEGRGKKREGEGRDGGLCSYNISLKSPAARHINLYCQWVYHFMSVSVVSVMNGPKNTATLNNVETSYFTQLKMCYLMTTFRCSSDILITSWFTARWSM